MTRTTRTAMLILALSLALPAVAHEPTTAEQQAMMEAYQKAGTPGEMHGHLAKMAGAYDISITSWEAPDGPPNVESGTATRTMILDGRVMREVMTSQMHGQPYAGEGLHGYDNVSGKHWATWNDSMSTGLMVSEGTCDDQGACEFTGSWNDPITKGKVLARMTDRWTSPTTEEFTMYTPGPDGKEMKMMQIIYTKKN